MQVGPKAFQLDDSASKTGKPSEGAVFFSKVISKKSDFLYLVEGPSGPLELTTREILVPSQSVRIRMNPDEKTAQLFSPAQQGTHVRPAPDKLIQMLLRSGFSLTEPKMEELLKWASSLNPTQARLSLLIEKRLKIRTKNPLEFLLKKITHDKEESILKSKEQDLLLSAQDLKKFFLHERTTDGALTLFNHSINNPSDHWIVVPFCFDTPGYPGKGLFKLNFDLENGLLKQAVIQIQKEKDSFFVLKMQKGHVQECRFYPSDSEEAMRFEKSDFPSELIGKFPKIRFRMREEKSAGFDGYDDDDLKSIDQLI